MNSVAARLLVVDDDRVFRLSTAALLRNDGYVVETAADGAEAINALRATEFDLMILDLRMPGIDGLTMIETLRIWGNGIPILMISGFGTVDTAVRALHLGADDFLTKPVEPAILSERVAELLERRPTQPATTEFATGLVGRAPATRKFLAALAKVAPTETTVLIYGETGSGKELAARAVHALSPRRTGPFIAVNCASLAEGVLESELFGHVRGAFTGATKDRAGVFEAANGGTIFLDEMGEISPTLQKRLLRVLQEREVTPVGATRPVKVNVRVVAATHRDLSALVRTGEFREDLLYRLSVFPVVVPPLRERRADIPLLVQHALTRLRDGMESRASLSCSPFAVRVLRAYSWPGNVRQLFAVLEASAIHADFGRIEAQHLPADVRAAAKGLSLTSLATESRYQASTRDDSESESILAALAETGGALARTAELLGMGRTTLWRKMKQLNLQTAVNEAGDAATSSDKTQ